MMAILDPTKLEEAVRVVTRLDENTSGISLKVTEKEIILTACGSSAADMSEKPIFILQNPFWEILLVFHSLVLSKTGIFILQNSFWQNFAACDILLIFVQEPVF